jgi:cathepsin B
MRVVILIALIGLSLSFFGKKPFLTEESLAMSASQATFETYSYEEHPFKDWTEEEVKGLMGAILPPLEKDYTLTVGDLTGLPDNFDSREQWPECIHPVRNQGHCGSCWAFAASEVLSDRFCIASKGQVNVVLSPEDLVECDKTDHGCQGGNPLFSWVYLKYYGIVTDECRPYTSADGKVEACQKDKCTGNVEFKKYHAKTLPKMLNTVEKIKQDLYANGPVETGFQVYEDFMNYKSGIYVHSTGKLLGGHAVKIVGWGKDEATNTDYWIVANSWGPEWGDKGFFKIKQGECGFEQMGVASTADV